MAQFQTPHHSGCPIFTPGSPRAFFKWYWGLYSLLFVQSEQSNKACMVDLLSRGDQPWYPGQLQLPHECLDQSKCLLSKSVVIKKKKKKCCQHSRIGRKPIKSRFQNFPNKTVRPAHMGSTLLGRQQNSRCTVVPAPFGSKYELPLATVPTWPN